MQKLKSIRSFIASINLFCSGERKAAIIKDIGKIDTTEEMHQLMEELRYLRVERKV